MLKKDFCEVCAPTEEQMKQNPSIALGADWPQAYELQSIVMKGNIAAALKAIEKAKTTISKVEASAEKKAVSLGKLQKAYELVNDAAKDLLF
jgi:hypothetical protein